MLYSITNSKHGFTGVHIHADISAAPQINSVFHENDVRPLAFFGLNDMVRGVV